MSNILLRGTTLDGRIRTAVAVTTELVEKARKSHNTTPTATAALGRAMIANIFLALNLKSRDTITMRIMGNGPLGTIITQGDAHHNVRGYVQNPSCHLPLNEKGKIDVGSAVGKEGFIYVTKDIGLKEPYTGCSTLVSGEIGDDVAYYLNQSEQTPAVVGVGVLIDRDYTCKAAGGFFIQAMPGVNLEDLQAIEKNVNNINSVTTLIEQGLGPEEILQSMLGAIKLANLSEERWNFSCTCNRNRTEKVLFSLGKEELQDMIEKNEGTELRCHFCNQLYTFTKEDLESIIRQGEN